MPRPEYRPTTPPTTIMPITAARSPDESEVTAAEQIGHHHHGCTDGEGDEAEDGRLPGEPSSSGSSPSSSRARVSSAVLGLVMMRSAMAFACSRGQSLGAVDQLQFALLLLGLLDEFYVSMSISRRNRSRWLAMD